MPLSRLPNGSDGAMVCEYNGVVWGPTADTVAFSVRPNLDPARRTVVSATYTITVVETIQGVVTTNAIVREKIAKLSRNGGRLKYKGRGFGDLDINIAGGLIGGLGKRDVAWGPITKEVTCKPTGAGKAVELSWTVEFTTVNCPDGLTSAGTILWFNFTVGFERDREGYTTRVYDGSLCIAQTRKKVDDKRLSATADEHLERMTPFLLPGFRRESQSERLSADKCTLYLTVRDVQLPGNLPPVRVVDGSIEHTWQSDGLFKWNGSISATYDIARGEGTANDAILPFRDLVSSRIADARKMLQNGAAPRPGLEAAAARLMGVNPGGPVNVMVLGASASEPNILGRLQVRLGIQYYAVGCAFSEILRSGGLWKPVPTGGGNPEAVWSRWVHSMPSVFDARGHAELVFTAKEDSLVDACIAGKPVVPQQTVADLVTTPQTVVDLSTSLFSIFPPPTPQNSWIKYQNFVTTSADTGRVIGRTLPGQPLARPSLAQSASWNAQQGIPTGSAIGGGLAVAGSGGAGSLIGGNTAARGETFVHQRTIPTVYVTMEGSALRAGYEIPVPELLTVNGARPELVGQPWFRTGIVGHTQVPIVKAEWSLTYAFTDELPKKAIPVPPNPFLA